MDRQNRLYSFISLNTWFLKWFRVGNKFKFHDFYFRYYISKKAVHFSLINVNQFCFPHGFIYTSYIKIRKLFRFFFVHNTSTGIIYTHALGAWYALLDGKAKHTIVPQHSPSELQLLFLRNSRDQISISLICKFGIFLYTHLIIKCFSLSCT